MTREEILAMPLAEPQPSAQRIATPEEAARIMALPVANFNAGNKVHCGWNMKCTGLPIGWVRGQVIDDRFLACAAHLKGRPYVPLDAKEQPGWDPEVIKDAAKAARRIIDKYSTPTDASNKEHLLDRIRARTTGRLFTERGPNRSWPLTARPGQVTALRELPELTPVGWDPEEVLGDGY